MKCVCLYSGRCGRRQHDTWTLQKHNREWDRCLDQVDKVKSSMLVEFLLFFYFLCKSQSIVFDVNSNTCTKIYLYSSYITCNTSEFELEECGGCGGYALVKIKGPGWGGGKCMIVTQKYIICMQQNYTKI